MPTGKLKKELAFPGFPSLDPAYTFIRTPFERGNVTGTMIDVVFKIGSVGWFIGPAEPAEPGIILKQKHTEYSTGR